MRKASKTDWARIEAMTDADIDYSDCPPLRENSSETILMLPVKSASAGQRVDQFLVGHLRNVSRARVQEMIDQELILVNDKVPKASLKLAGGERIMVLGPSKRNPLRAIAEDIPLDIVYEDDDLAVVNKPAGMMVHAGAGATDDARNRGTLVNALLHHFGNLSNVGGEMRPGIVHRLDKETSGLIVVAKNDAAHQKLAEQFSERRVHKTYLALVHGWPRKDRGTIHAEISRDAHRRTRMTTRRSGGREAVSHYEVRDKFESVYGKFALLAVTIETGRTHQIRVHLSSIGHPIVGDSLYGAPREVVPQVGSNKPGGFPKLALGRNFLHAAAIELEQPLTHQPLVLERPLPPELLVFLQRLKHPSAS